MLVLLILLGAFAAAGVAITLGRLAIERLQITLHRQEQLAVSFVLGSGIWSFIVFVLCTVHVIYKGVLIGLAAAIVLYGWKKGFHRLQGEAFPPLPIIWKRLLTAVAAVFGVLYLAHAMAPEVSPDGAAYHLGLVGQYYRARGFLPITTNIYASLSQAMEMLFMLPFAIGRHSAAAMSHLTFLFALPWLILSYGRRINQPAAGAFAAILIFCAQIGRAHV